MKKRIKVIAPLLIVVLVIVTCAGCHPDSPEQLQSPDSMNSASVKHDEELIDISLEMVPLTESPALFSIPMPVASGINVSKNQKAEIDISNTQDGYFMAKYLQSTSKELRVIVKGPSGASYTYTLKSDGNYEVYPLSDGNGSYSISVYEQVSGNKYATVNTATVHAKLNDEFAPFIRPNQYVNYHENSQAVKKASELTRNLSNHTEQIAAVYNYVIENLSYDKQLAATVQSGYLPDVDSVLAKGKGICFDYAAVMVAMLRSQGIPSKLVVGYTGEIYHAWINTYSEEEGWVNGIVYFDGNGWKHMDPTFASGGGSSDEILTYIENESNYTAKYLY